MTAISGLPPVTNPGPADTPAPVPGAVWDHRQVDRYEYEVRRDGQPVVGVSFVGTVARSSLLVRLFVKVCESADRAHGFTMADLERELAACEPEPVEPFERVASAVPWWACSCAEPDIEPCPPFPGAFQCRICLRPPLPTVVGGAG